MCEQQFEELLLRPAGLRRDLREEAPRPRAPADVYPVAPEIYRERILDFFARIQHRYLDVDLIELVGPDAVIAEAGVVERRGARHLADALARGGIGLEVPEAPAQTSARLEGNEAAAGLGELVAHRSLHGFGREVGRGLPPDGRLDGAPRGRE